jgi:hypothetical protein
MTRIADLRFHPEASGKLPRFRGLLCPM